MRNTWILLSIIILSVVAPSGSGFANVDYRAMLGMHPTALALARALDSRLTLHHSRAGDAVHVYHCRKSETGCRSRIAALARIITESSEEYGVDPFLTAGMAIRETKLNPMAVGPVGERGIIQLHPLYRGKTVPFVYDEAYRDRCVKQPGACQREVVDAGLSLFNWAVKHCGGSIMQGLGWYNSGHCRDSFYGRAVLRERRRLLRLAKRPIANSQSVFRF